MESYNLKVLFFELFLLLLNRSFFSFLLLKVVLDICTKVQCDSCLILLCLNDKGGAEIVLAEAEEGVSPGQACVFYAANSDRVLGGGWISGASQS